jgi:hypothetical protein
LIISGDTIQPSIGTNITVPDAMGINVGSNRVGQIGAGYGGFTGNVLQVKNAVRTSTFDTTSTSFIDIPNLSISITPRYNTSTILLFYNASISVNSGYYSGGVRLARNGTGIYIGDASASRTRASSWAWSDGQSYGINSLNGSFLDSPSTISAITYSLQIMSGYSGQIIYLNRGFSNGDGDGIQFGRTASSIVAMEIMA